VGAVPGIAPGVPVLGVASIADRNRADARGDDPIDQNGRQQDRSEPDPAETPADQERETEGNGHREAADPLVEVLLDEERPIPAERAPLDDSGGRSRRRYGEGTAALGAGISARLVAGEVAGGQTVGTVVAQTHGSSQPSAIRFSSKGAPVGTAAPQASQPRTSHLELRTPLRREPGRDREVGREQLTDQHEEERDVEKSGGRL